MPARIESQIGVDVGIYKEFLRLVSLIFIYQIAQSFFAVHAQDFSGKYEEIERTTITTGRSDRYSNWGGDRCYGGPKAPPLFVANDDGVWKIAMPWEFGKFWLCGALDSQGQIYVRTDRGYHLNAYFDQSGQTIRGRIDGFNCGYQMTWQKDRSYNKNAIFVIRKQCSGKAPETALAPNQAR
jgi:hypothetical protein